MLTFDTPFPFIQPFEVVEPEDPPVLESPLMIVLFPAPTRDTPDFRVMELSIV